MAKGPSTPPKVAPTMMPVRWLVFECTVLAGEVKMLGGKLDMGNDGVGRKEEVALLFVTLSVIDSTSNRVGESPWRNVTPNVVVCDSGRFSAMISWLMLVLTCCVIVTPLGSAVREKLTVALERGDVRRYNVDALKVKNNWGTAFPVCGIGPVVLVTITDVPLMLGKSMYIKH